MSTFQKWNNIFDILKLVSKTETDQIQIPRSVTKAVRLIRKANSNLTTMVNSLGVKLLLWSNTM